jgi:hypothetical protein
MFSSSNEYTNLDKAYPAVNFEFSRTMYPVHDKNYFTEHPIQSSDNMISADWQPEAANNAELLSKVGIKTNWQYRKYLIGNAKDIIEYNYRESNNENGIYVREAAVPKINCNSASGMTNSPRLQTSVLDTTHRFGKPASDLKNMYLSREQLHALTISPVIEQKDLRNIVQRK